MLWKEPLPVAQWLMAGITYPISDKQVLAPQEYLLGIEDIDLSKAAFPEIAHLAQISIRDLKSMLERPRSG